jgi:hypothetical protein
MNKRLKTQQKIFYTRIDEAPEEKIPLGFFSMEMNGSHA